MDDGSGEAELEAEWDAIELKTEEARHEAANNVGAIKAKTDDADSNVDIQGVQQWISQLTVDPEVLRPLREETVASAGGFCCGVKQRSRLDVPKLGKRLQQNKDLVLFLSLTNFDFDVTMHHRMLRTLYEKLTRNKVCPTIGRHWEVLGFENKNPCLDLNRHGGVLNVVHLFLFWARHCEVLKAIYLLSLDDVQNFPLVSISVTFTRMVIESLLSGALSSLSGRAGSSVFDTVSSVHHGCMCFYYDRWRANKRTVADKLVALQEVQDLLSKRPTQLLDALAQAGKNRSKGPISEKVFEDLEQNSSGNAKGAPQQKPSTPPRRLQGYEADGE